VRRACVVCGAVAIEGSKICGRQACRDARSRQRKGKRISWRPHERAAREAMATNLFCYFCGEPDDRPDDPFERHHVVSRRDGGGNDPENYAPAHRSCNRGARAKEAV
jgi:HNH endonuclease